MRNACQTARSSAEHVLAKPLDLFHGNWVPDA
jgi:hypothetical protein